MNIKLDLQNLLNAMNAAETRYLAKQPKNAKGEPLTVSADINGGRKVLTEQVVAHIAPMISDAPTYLQYIADRAPTKAVLRACEFFSALASGNLKEIDRTTALCTLSAGCNNGTVSRDGIAFATTGKGTEFTSDQFKKMETLKKVQRAMGTVGVTTFAGQVSRSFGKNGFASGLGMGAMQKGKDGREFAQVDQKSPFVVALVSMIESASEATLALAFAPKEKKAKQ
jgi:hypothetical protein